MGRPVINLIDHKFGRWTVIAFAGVVKRNSQWKCRCLCGVTAIVSSFNLKNGQSQSCGCRQRQHITNLGHSMKQHGDCLNYGATVEYRAWIAMKSRCGNKNTPRFNCYGGRGIKICKRWLNSFENFLADMGRKPSPAHSLDRIDNDGDYKPSNCRWATSGQQYFTRRKTRKIRKGVYAVDLTSKPEINPQKREN